MHRVAQFALVVAACGSPTSTPIVDASDAQDECSFADPFADCSPPDAWPPPSPCGLDLNCDPCGNGPPTRVSGTVYAPNGTLPVYNVLVYVPNAPLDPLASGVTCNRCSQVPSGKPITMALTDAHGNFTLKDVPVGPNIPIVIQTGKWRRKVTLPNVMQCVDNPIDPKLTRLPKNQSEGSMPKIAVTTGADDPLGCIVPKLGIDPQEITPASGKGAVNVFIGNGAGPASATDAASTLWNDASVMKKYDLILLSCEGAENLGTKPMSSRVEMQKYLDAGGRVFATHYHYVWFQYGPQPFPTTAAWQGDGMGPGSTTPAKIDATFPKGKAMADWLKLLEPSLAYGELPLAQSQNDVGAVTNATTTRWLYAATMPEATKHLTFNTAVGTPPQNQCGKAAFGDFHVGGTSVVDATFPAGCTPTLGAEEKALAFVLFDLQSCPQNDKDPPQQPPLN